LRSYYDKFNEEVASKITDADAKAQAYDFLHKEFLTVVAERDELLKAKDYLEKKLQETVHMVGILEEERRGD
jgi:hypothetical protein